MAANRPTQVSCRKQRRRQSGTVSTAVLVLSASSCQQCAAFVSPGPNAYKIGSELVRQQTRPLERVINCPGTRSNCRLQALDRHDDTAVSSLHELDSNRQAELLGEGLQPAIQHGLSERDHHHIVDHNIHLESLQLGHQISIPVSIGTSTTPLASSAQDSHPLQPPPFRERPLGSFEKLLTKTRPGSSTLLSTPHVWVAVVRGTLGRERLREAVIGVLSRHPLLRACIKGTGKPEKVVLETIRTTREDVDPLRFCESPYGLAQLADRILVYLETPVGDTFESTWQQRLQHNLENGHFDIANGPNWRLEVLRSASGSRTALVFTMNHAIEDQKSANIVLHELLSSVSAGAPGGFQQQPERSHAMKFVRAGQLHPTRADPPQTQYVSSQLQLPPSMEEAMVAGPTFNLNTLGYMARQFFSGLFEPMMLHDHLPSKEVIEATQACSVDKRRTFCEFRRMQAPELQGVLEACRARGVTLTAALSAAVLMACSDVAHTPGDNSWHHYKFLLAMDLRRFGLGGGPGADWTGGTVACAGGAMDFIAGLPANSGRLLTLSPATSELRRFSEENFWRLAYQCREETKKCVESNIPREAVAVFDWGMKSIEIRDVCDREASNPHTLGRAYTCGVSNMGVYPHGADYGSLALEGIHYATSHAAWGSLFQLSCGTVGDRFCMTFQFPEPIVDRAMASTFADSLMGCLRAACLGETQAEPAPATSSVKSAVPSSSA